MGILTKIKQRPESEKKIFSLISASILTAVIVFVWFSFNTDSYLHQSGDEPQTKLSSISPIQAIKDQFSKVFYGSSASIVEPSDTSLYSTTSTASSDELNSIISSSTESLSTSTKTIATTTVKISTSTKSNLSTSSKKTN